MIEKERPDALLATLGGQTALNAAMALHADGVLEKYGVELIGASIEAIERGENRESFKRIVEGLGGEVADSRIAHTMEECVAAADELGYPCVVRPSFTMGGSGSGMAYNEADLRQIAGSGLAASPDHRGPHGGVDHRLEGVRAGGDARQGRQRRHRLLASRTSTRWACTPATRSPSRRP